MKVSNGLLIETIWILWLSGGIGSRATLKMWLPKGSVGSSPTWATISVEHSQQYSTLRDSDLCGIQH